MLAVAESDDGIVCLTDLARTLDVSISNLQQPLKALVAVGLLSPLPQNESRRKFYIRNPSAAWQWATELYEACDDVAIYERDLTRSWPEPEQTEPVSPTGES